MRKRRLYLSGRVYFISFNTEQGLPFVALPFMNMLVLSAIARAQRLHPVTIIALTMEANHCHILIRVTDPEAVSGFVGYMKAECAHYLNALLGREQHTVWAPRFDDPEVLDLNTALKRFSYTILNPVKDRLVHRMADYPGVSSYGLLVKGEKELKVKSIPRSAVYKLRNPHRPINENDELVDYFSADLFQNISIRFEPEVLRLAYSDSRMMSEGDFLQLLQERIRNDERQYQEKYKEQSKMGVARLRGASILKTHVPPKRGRKMICLGESKEIRAAHIKFYRACVEEARRVWLRWCQGELSLPFPPGMFAPHPPRMANLVPGLAGG